MNSIGYVVIIVSLFKNDFIFQISIFNKKVGRAQRLWLLDRILPSFLKSTFSESSFDVEEYEPCIDNYVTSYLNQPKVRQAIHVTESKVRK